MFSPADYAAYSRATGRPYPEDEQERADMYGEVREFRNNQMKRDEGPGLAAGLLGGAAVLGTIAGGAVAGRRFLNNSRRGGVKKQDLPLSSEGMSAVRRVKEPTEINDAAAAGQKMPSNPVSDSIVQDNADAGEGFKRFSRRADEIGKQASEIQAQNLADSAVETMVNIQQKREPVVSQQSLEATDTAFDQKVQDLQASVQRNEDLDVGSIDFDASARQMFEDERIAIADSLKQQGITPTPGLIEANMAERFGAQSSKYGPDYTKNKQSMQIYATYGGEFGGDSVVIAGEKFPISKLKTEYVSPETAMASERMRDDVKDFVGNVRLEATSERNRRRQQDPELAAKELEFANNEEVMNIAAANADMGKDVTFNESVYDAYYIKNEKLGSEIESRKKYSPLELAQIAGAEKYAREKQTKITTNFPKRLQDNFEEGQRVFAELDPMTGEPIPGTQELRSGRRAIDQKKGGGGRNVAEFSAGSRDNTTQDAINTLQSSAGTQEFRGYEKDQFGQRPNTGLTGVDLEGAPFTDDRSQTGRKITREGIELTGTQPGTFESAVNPFDRLDDETLGMITMQGNDEEARVAGQVLARRARGETTTNLVGDPLQSNRVVTSVEPTDAMRSSVKMSEAIRRAGRLRSERNPRGGQIPGEMETLRRTMPEEPRAERFGPRSRVSGLPPQQRTIPGVTAYEARQRPSEADKAAQQLESYMSRLQRGRSTPLTSEVVIQPRLF
jgi:hypothetical protein